MSAKNKALILLLAAYAILGVGCASKPISAPSTAAVTGDIHRAQTATSQADAKATVILQWLKTHP